MSWYKPRKSACTSWATTFSLAALSSKWLLLQIFCLWYNDIACIYLNWASNSSLEQIDSMHNSGTSRNGDTASEPW